LFAGFAIALVLFAELAQLARRVAERTADLSAANAEFARASRLKGEFLANMSHELRTPLNASLGLSESLLEQRSGPLTERQMCAVTAVESSGRHLLSLINGDPKPKMIPVVVMTSSREERERRHRGNNPQHV